MKTTSSGLFSWRQILLHTAVFVGAVILGQRILRHIADFWIPFDCPYYWPVSVFNFRVPSLRDLAVAAAVAVAFFIFVRYLESKQYKLGLSIAAGVLLITGLTFIHGFEVGFNAPIAGNAQTGVLEPYSLEGQEYYHDALRVTDPVDFLQRYNQIQPTLNRHSHTHPPGAVLSFYFLQKLFRDPAIIAIFIMLVSMSTIAYFFRRLMRTEVKDETARYMSFILLLLPAVQIYFLASLDALIVALMVGSLYLFCFGKGRSSDAGSALMLNGAFLLTFVSLFILPVLAGFDLIVRRSVKRSAIVIGSVVVFHGLLYLLTGYDAWHSFRTASHYENPLGFMLFVDPANYFFTRLEDVAEIAFFFGPFLAMLAYKGLRKFDLRPLNVLTGLACATLLAMYAVGAWRTGETARACAFIYPFLLFPVGRYLEESDVGPNGRMWLAALVFVQAVGMQVFGNYFW